MTGPKYWAEQEWCPHLMTVSLTFYSLHIYFEQILLKSLSPRIGIWAFASWSEKANLRLIPRKNDKLFLRAAIFNTLTNVLSFTSFKAGAGIFSFFKIYLFLTALGLRCCIQAFSSCGKHVLLSRCDVRASHWGAFSCCSVWALVHIGSVLVARGLSCPVACGVPPDQGSNPRPMH